MEFEVNIIKALQSLSCPFLDAVMKIVAYLFDYPLVIGLFLILLLLKKHKESLLFLIIEGVSYGLQVTLKAIINRPRPFVSHSDILNIFEASNSSFPSGHSTTCMGAVIMLCYLIYKSNITKKKKIIYYSLIALMPLVCMINRMYLGQHYLSDCIGGFVLSLIVGTIVLSLYRFIKNKRKIGDTNGKEEKSLC